MVLGANLKPMKTLEINYMAKVESKKDNLFASNFFETKPNPPKIESALLHKEAGPELLKIDTYKAFKNTIDKFAKDSQFMKANIDDFLGQASDEKTITKIISIDFDAKYLVLLLKLVNANAETPGSTFEKLLDFLDAVSQSKNFSMMVKKMLNRAEKTLILKTVKEFPDKELSESAKELINKVIQSFS